MIPFNQVPGTNFHDVNLDWIINTVKAAVEDWTATKADWITTQEAWTETQEAWTELYTYVHNYFNTLDVSQEISAKIDAMAQDGSLLALIRDTVNQTAAAAAVSTTEDWLDENITQETGYVLDSSLTLSNAAAPADKVGAIVEKSPNLFCVTSAENGDYGPDDRAAITFQSPSRFSVTASAGTGFKLPCMGSTEAFSNTVFNANISAGTYYPLIKRTGISAAHVYPQFHYEAGSSNFTSIRAGETFTVTDDAEVWLAFGGSAFTGSFEMMLIAVDEAPETPPAYVDYGWITAQDTVARDQISSAQTTIGLIGAYVEGWPQMAAQSSAAALFHNVGQYPYKCYPRSFHCTQVAEIPGNPDSPNSSYATTGMASDGIRYLYIMTRLSESGEGSMVMRTYDTIAGTFIKEEILTGLGHGQAMCYKDGELFVVAWFTGDSDPVADGGSYDKIVVLDAATYAVERTIALGDIVTSEVTYDKRLQAIAWSPDFGCFVGVTAKVGENTDWSTQAILMFSEDELYSATQVADRDHILPGVIDGCIVTPSYIIPMTTYQPTYFTWDNCTNVSQGNVEYNTIQKYLHDVEDTDLTWESESAVLCNGAIYVNAIKFQTVDGALKNKGSFLFRVTPYNFRFLS